MFRFVTLYKCTVRAASGGGNYIKIINGLFVCFINDEKAEDPFSLYAEGKLLKYLYLVNPN